MKLFSQAIYFDMFKKHTKYICVHRSVRIFTLEHAFNEGRVAQSV